MCMGLWRDSFLSMGGPATLLMAGSLTTPSGPAANWFRWIERSGASRVDLVHGYTEPIARILRQRGIQAYAAGALSEPEDDGRQE